MTFILATHNAHKLREIKAIIGTQFQLKSLHDIGFHDEIPEPHDTLEANALEKVRTLHRHYPNASIVAEDTGLEVVALHNAPGVITAHYAGSRDPQANMQLLLQNMAGIVNRQAQFRTVLALIMDSQEYLFEGIIKGHIANEPIGKEGFGYDPIFVPNGYAQTYAQMTDDLKNSISHRRQAVEKLAVFLNNLQQK